MRKINLILLALITAFALASCDEAKTTVENTDPHPEWSYSAVMYELNTRQFTPEGTFIAAETHLPRLKDLGVDIIWFMPIHPIGVVERKGELGSYYSISDYKDVNPEFGTLDDFKHFVDEAHRQGFKVLMDWVPNHTSHDAVWINNQGWYQYDEEGNPYFPYDWSDIAQLDFGNMDMRDAMIDAMKFWLTDMDVDGYRCDYAVGPPMDFWEKAIPELKAAKADIFMLAEAEEVELHTEGGFDATYAWKAHHLMNGIAKGRRPVEALAKYVMQDYEDYPIDAIRLQMTSNHDENSWNGTEFERMGDGAKTFAALTYVIPGMPLIYNGQEVGLDRRLEFFVKDEIDWVDRGGFKDLYTKLNALKHRSAALQAGEKGGMVKEIATGNVEQVYAFSREKDGDTIVAVFNLSAEPADVKMELGELEGKYRNAMTGEEISAEGPQECTLGAWEYLILEK